MKAKFHHGSKWQKMTSSCCVKACFAFAKAWTRDWVGLGRLVCRNCTEINWVAMEIVCLQFIKALFCLLGSICAKKALGREFDPRLEHNRSCNSVVRVRVLWTHFLHFYFSHVSRARLTLLLSTAFTRLRARILKTPCCLHLKTGRQKIGNRQWQVTVSFSALAYKYSRPSSTLPSSTFSFPKALQEVCLRRNACHRYKFRYRPLSKTDENVLNRELLCLPHALSGLTR
jgi:hypothetical protein